MPTLYSAIFNFPMKCLISLFFIALIVSSSLFADGWHGIELPEETDYNISYLFVIAGHGSIRIEKTNFEGREAIKITGKVWSSKFFSLFYKIDDTVVSIIDAETLKPLWHSVDYHEGTYRRKAEYNFDYQKLVCTSEEGTVRIKEGILEPLGAYCFLRIGGIKKGIPFEKEVFDGHKINEVSAVITKEERIKTKFGKRNTLVIKPTLKDFRKEGITEVQEKISLYLQKEPPRVPYLIKGKLAIGSLKAKLKKITHS